MTAAGEAQVLGEKRRPGSLIAVVLGAEEVVCGAWILAAEPRGLLE